MKNLQLPEFLRWIDTDGARLVSTALAARVTAEMERERVNAYEIPFFATWGFTADKRRDETRAAEVLTNPRELYLSNDDERTTEYYATLDRLHREHGFTGPEGHCPALTAEWARTQAENAVIESLSALLGISAPVTLHHRAQMLDIAIGAAVKRMAEAA